MSHQPFSINQFPDCPRSARRCWPAAAQSTPDCIEHWEPRWGKAPTLFRRFLPASSWCQTGTLSRKLPL